MKIITAKRYSDELIIQRQQLSASVKKKATDNPHDKLC